MGQNDKAIADLDHAIDFDPQMATAYLNRGAAYENKGEHERGIADYSRAISLDPQLKVAYFNRGAIYESQGEHDRAIADFDNAIRLDPNDADTTAGASPSTIGVTRTTPLPITTRRSG